MANYNQAFTTGLYPPGSSNHRYDIGIHPSSTETIPAVLIIDSSQRNRDVYENPGHYVVQLIKPYTDVISVELTQANIPNSGYAVNSTNNKITFTFNNDNTDVTTFTATLGVGDYADVSALRTAIASALNTITERVVDVFSVTTVLDVTGAITITAPNVIENTDTPLASRDIIFIAGQTNNADTIIGLGNNNTAAAAEVTMPYAYVLRPDRYVVLEIRGMERCEGNSNALMNCFAIIPVDTTANNFGLLKNGDTIDNDIYVHHFPEPLRKLNSLEITFRTPGGSICEFNGRDHFLVFEIICLSRPHKVSNS